MNNEVPKVFGDDWFVVTYCVLVNILFIITIIISILSKNVGFVLQHNLQ